MTFLSNAERHKWMVGTLESCLTNWDEFFLIIIWKLALKIPIIRTLIAFGCWKQCAMVWTSVSQRFICYSFVPHPVPLWGGWEPLDGETYWAVKVRGPCCGRELCILCPFLSLDFLRPWEAQGLLPWYIDFSLAQSEGQLTDTHKAVRHTITSQESICVRYFVLLGQ